MVSYRFPFSIPPLPTGIISPATIACSVALTAGISAGISISQNSTSLQNTLLNSFVHKKPCFGSLSLSEGVGDVAVKEEKSGVVFPGVVEGNKGLLGVGLRRKVLFGLKNIDVYAFGVYADDSDIKNLNEKYATLSTTELKNADITQDLMKSDVSVTVRLQIVYGKLSIRSVRNAFEDSVGTRLKKFGGSDNKELLQKFTSQFSDEYKIPRGSIINLHKEKGYVLRTTIDGKEIGSVQSQLLCRSILDLYIGDEPFDSKAKEDIDNKLVSAITK